MATSPYARDWIDDLRVLQDHAGRTLAEQADELRVEHGHEVRRTARVTVLSLLLVLVTAACAAVAVLR